MGVGRMWSPKTGWGNAKDVLAQNDLEPIKYKPKEVDRNYLGELSRSRFD